MKATCQFDYVIWLSLDIAFGFFFGFQFQPFSAGGTGRQKKCQQPFKRCLSLRFFCPFSVCWIPFEKQTIERDTLQKKSQSKHYVIIDCMKR